MAKEAGVSVEDVAESGQETVKRPFTMSKSEPESEFFSLIFVAAQCEH